MSWREEPTFEMLARRTAAQLDEALARLRELEPTLDETSAGSVRTPDRYWYTANMIPFLQTALEATKIRDMEIYQAQYDHLNRMLEYAERGAPYSEYDEAHDRICIPGCRYGEYVQR